MPDPHLNIFHAYRGPNIAGDAGIRQLEDNLTRALAIVIRSVRETPYQRQVCALLHHDEWDHESPFRIELQVGHPPPRLPVNRRLVVIHGGHHLKFADSGHDAASGRADAVITSRNAITVIESKLEGIADRSQLQRHRSTFSIPVENTTDISWVSLARGIRSLPVSNRSQPVARFILRQFEEYLTMNGFGGLTYDHFSYFMFPPEQRDQLVKDGIRRSLEEIGASLATSFPVNWNPNVLNIAANATEASVVVEFGKRARNPHLTVSIEPAGLSIHPNIELNEPYERFRRSLELNPDGLVRLLSDLGKQRIRSHNDIPWRFRVVRRTSLGAPRQYYYYPSADIATATFRDWNNDEIKTFVDSVTRKPEEEAAPQVLIVKTYPVAKVVENDNLEETLRNDVREIEPFFDWIGEPIRSQG